jgi:type IV pilus assembly protein PilQ
MRRLALLAALLAVALPATAGATSGRISVALHDAEIGNAIRIVTQPSNLNFVLDDEVKGKVTLRLRNVPWRQALDTVLRSKGLGMESSGTVVRIAPLTKLASEKEAEARLAKATLASRPLKTRLVPVSNARAADLAPLLKSSLTERGTVQVDERTNTLIVRDVE